MIANRETQIQVKMEWHPEKQQFYLKYFASPKSHSNVRRDMAPERAKYWNQKIVEYLENYDAQHNKVLNDLEKLIKPSLFDYQPHSYLIEENSDSDFAQGWLRGYRAGSNNRETIDNECITELSGLLTSHDLEINTVIMPRVDESAWLRMLEEFTYDVTFRWRLQDKLELKLVKIITKVLPE